MELDELLAADPREASLPKWAKYRLQGLRTVVRDRGIKLSIATRSFEGDTDTWIEPSHTRDFEAVPMPAGSTVMMTCGRTRVRVRVDRSRVFGTYVSARSDMGRIFVFPEAANSVSIVDGESMEDTYQARERSLAHSIMQNAVDRGITVAQMKNMVYSKTAELVELAKTLR